MWQVPLPPEIGDTGDSGDPAEVKEEVKQEVKEDEKRRCQGGV